MPTNSGVQIADLHLAVCRRFSDAVGSGEGKWDRPTPCANWDARAVVEHVIGFHDVLLLRPLGLKSDRPRDDPRRRWDLTVDRLGEAFARTVPTKLVPRLTRDVLVHTWDLARAVGADDRLDPGWCATFSADCPRISMRSALQACSRRRSSLTTTPTSSRSCWPLWAGIRLGGPSNGVTPRSEHPVDRIG